MCMGTVAEHHHHHPGISRRAFLTTGVAAAAGAALVTGAGPARAATGARRGHGVVDLTHRLVRTFPSFLGPQAVFDQVLFTIPNDGFYTKQWTFDEHIGTHIDTPGHFSLGMKLVDELDPAALIAPIVVVDIADKAEADPNATVTADDLMAWEQRHGRIPKGAIVAMHSGWASRVDDGDTFRGGAGFPDLNFPGFSADATDWLLSRRDVVGIGVDTLSLDPGNSQTFDVHVSFLGSGRYGIENLTNLDLLPPKGATAFVGAIPWEEGSGSPVRVLATVPGRRGSANN